MQYHFKIIINGVFKLYNSNNYYSGKNILFLDWCFFSVPVRPIALYTQSTYAWGVILTIYNICAFRFIADTFRIPKVFFTFLYRLEYYNYSVIIYSFITSNCLDCVQKRKKWIIFLKIYVRHNNIIVFRTIIIYLSNFILYITILIYEYYYHSSNVPMFEG